jgi:dUTP pyrophosphatase
MKIKALIKKLSSKVNIPEYKTTGSSGLDLEAFIEQDIIIRSKETALIPTGISVAIPENLEIQIRPRSGLAFKNKITVLNTPGTIDADYRGEIKIILINLGDNDFVIKNGDRIAQMVLCPIVKAEFEVKDNLPESIRGEGGFGSTGKN